MGNIDIRNCLYHGIVDWENYDSKVFRESVCLDKLENILEKRFIVRPCDFRKFGISHRDTANPYTYYLTFLACSPESIYASRFKKDIQDDNGYLVATSYSNFGVLFDPRLLDELPISESSFCDREIVVEDNISLDTYGVGIYVNPFGVTEAGFENIKTMLKGNDYDFSVVSVYDGAVITSLDEEKERVQRLSLKL